MSRRLRRRRRVAQEPIVRHPGLFRSRYLPYPSPVVSLHRPRRVLPIRHRPIVHIRSSLDLPKSGLAFSRFRKRETVLRHPKCVRAKAVRRKMYFRAGRGGGALRRVERRSHPC